VKAGVAPERSGAVTLPIRRWSLVGAAFVCLLTFLPPVSSLAHRYELGQVLRYGLWAMVVPTLVVVGAPWRHAAWAETLAQRRRRHPELWRSVGFVLVYGLVVVWWFTPMSVRATWGHPWLRVIEAVTLIAGGIGLWLELAESPPLAPRVGGLRSVVLGTAAMWLVWIEAYLVAMSHSGWYPTFHHVAGQGLSQAADQQVAAVILWFMATVVFVPVIFVDAMQWLHGEENPDDELRRLLREQRRGATAIIERRAAERPGDGAVGA
jgi:cytochrome c oxidase assembly factor CtaG